ncbi:MAG: Rrf2 family transcriptional regulator [Actinobacteria bacterium]|nr:Rrf2 family transcriptional regulator [Actinomycetota bacterium]
MELTRKAEYAIAALVELASHPGNNVLLSRDIAERQGIPIKLVAQIISALGRAGWVRGVRGAGGGVKLIADPAGIASRDVVELIEGPIAINPCLVKGAYCDRQSDCPLKGVWARAQRQMLQVLEGTTIADLASGRERVGERLGRSSRPKGPENEQKSLLPTLDRPSRRG